MNVTKTDRGFERIDFDDRSGESFSLQVSTLPNSQALRLWCSDGRMHLSREQVAELVRHLQAWLATGSLEVGQ